MRKVILGFIIGIILCIFIIKFNEINCYVSEDLFKILIPILVAGIAGIIALYQVRSNILVSYKIRWIENIKNNLSE